MNAICCVVLWAILLMLSKSHSNLFGEIEKFPYVMNLNLMSDKSLYTSIMHNLSVSIINFDSKEAFFPDDTAHRLIRSVYKLKSYTTKDKLASGEESTIASHQRKDMM
jgi:hypothetical protein